MKKKILTSQLRSLLTRLLPTCLCILLFYMTDAFGATLNAATNGTTLSADTNSTNGTGSTALTGPSVVETTAGDIGTGSIVLNAPTDYIFDTTSNVTATVTCNNGGTKLLLGAGPGAATQTVTPTTTSISITVFGKSASKTCTITWSGIKVRPKVGTPLAATENITEGGNSVITGVTSGANAGPLTEVAGAAKKLAFVQSPTNTPATSSITPAVTVQVQDQYGNNRTTAADTQSITMAIGTNPASGTLSGTTPVAAVTGLATFSNLSINNVGSGYTLTASSTGLTSITSVAFNITGALNNFLVEASAGGNIASQIAGTPFNIKITARDVSNSTVTAFTGTVTLTSTGTLSGTPPITTANFSGGILASQSVTILNTGNFTITATRTTGGIESGTSNSFTVTAGTVTGLQILVPGETAAPGTASGKIGTPTAQTQTLAFPVTVNAVDANWNVVSSVTDMVGITSSDGAANLPANAVLVAGTKTYSVTLNTAGTATVTASDVTNPARTANTSPAITVSAVGRDFNAFENSTATGAIMGKIYTKIAGTPFTLDLIAIDNSHTIVNTGYNKTVTVALLDSSNDSGALDTFACRSTWIVIQTLTVSPDFALVTGRIANVSFTENNAYPNVRVRITSNSGTIKQGCSNDNFAIRPSGFINITSNMTNTTTSGTPNAIAGSGKFTITATSAPVTTTLYNGTPKINNAKVEAHVGKTQDGVVTGAFPAAISGIATGTNAFTYSEVGNFRFLGSTPAFGDNTARGIYDDKFTLVDQSSDCTDDFSNTPVASGSDIGKVGCKFGLTANTSYFGRFYPNSFMLTASVMTNRSDIAGCDAQTTGTITGAPSTSLSVTSIAGFVVGDTIGVRGAGTAGADLTTTITAITGTTFTLSTAATTNVAGASVYKPVFTYKGESIGLAFTLTAQNGLAIPTTTQNYTTSSSFAQLDMATPASSGLGAENLGTLYTANLTVTSTAGTWAAGVANVTATLLMNRGTVADGPFNSFNLGIRPVDLDNVQLQGYDMELDGTIPGNDHSKVGSTQIRFGRLKLSNAHGSELLALPVSAAMQYFNGTAFVTNTADSCTSIQSASISLTQSPANCSSVSNSIVFTSGIGNMKLAKPLAKCRADMTINLGVPENKSYLRVGATYIDNPTARATFGIYKGGPIIYLREMY